MTLISSGLPAYSLLSKNGPALLHLRSMALTVRCAKRLDETHDHVIGYSAFIYDQNDFVIASAPGNSRANAIKNVYQKWLKKRGE